MSGGAEGKQLVSGGAGGRLCVSGGTGQQKKNYCDDPFQTVPGSIPGSCIPAFTGTLHNSPVSGPLGVKFQQELLLNSL